MSAFDEITETIKRSLGETSTAERVIKAVIRDHAGATVYVPATTQQQRAQRNLQIRRDRVNGSTMTRITSRYGLSPAHVRRVCR